MTATPPDGMCGYVLDAAALITLADGGVYAATFVDVTIERGLALLVPAAALSEAWQSVTSYGSTQQPAERMEVLLDGPTLLVEPLDSEAARAAGALLVNRPETRPDVPAAHVVTCARSRQWPVLAGQPHRLYEIDPSLPVAKLPGT